MIVVGIGHRERVAVRAQGQSGRIGLIGEIGEIGEIGGVTGQRLHVADQSAADGLGGVRAIW